MSVLRGLLIAVAMGGVSIASSIPVVLMPQPAAAQGVETIVVEGNRRVEAETVRSYFRPGPGGRLDQSALDDGLKALIGTGLFQDVKISQSGGRLVVSVVENAVIGRIAFEGNKKIKDEQLSAEIQSKPRGTFSRALVQKK
jgi:outer membrane protein insertion porin family